MTKFDILLVIVVIVAAMIASTIIAFGQSPDVVDLEPESYLPLVVGRCEGITAQVAGGVNSLIARADGLKSVTYYRDAEHFGVLWFNQASLCFDGGPWCNTYRGCILQIVIDDPETSRCWKSTIFNDYQGERTSTPMHLMSEEPCDSDIVLPLADETAQRRCNPYSRYDRYRPQCQPPVNRNGRVQRAI